ncbi:MAG: redox-sensing transcriptional repressor Rex [Chitinispirillaceae bacterium]|nr:redox-sensing transcriptional repressor Rex [Chitinispirillaceae bacterium]
MITKKNYIIRLSRYKSALYRFERLGFVKIFSDYLAEAVGVTSAQVRKDFSIFGIYGHKRGGYQISTLIEKLNDILGKNEVQRVILVGAGSLGSALMKYKNFEKEGIKIVAVFDIDPSKHNARLPLPILPIEDIDRLVKEQHIKIGMLCVPDIAAQQMLDVMTGAGIKGVLNFAPIRLKTTEECVVSDVNLEVELENLIYFVNASERPAPSKQPLPAQ